MTSRLLLVSDLSYPAQGRRYGDEDVFLASRLREEFALAVCHPLDAIGFMAEFDAVLVRNTGPVIHYQDEYDAFCARARAGGVKVFTELTGRGDMAGKDYLVELTAAGFPVIPTVDDMLRLPVLPPSNQYVVKPKQGSDSIGLRFVTPAQLADRNLEGMLVQPKVRFQYEVSFYFIGHEYQYAMYAPDPERRWQLARYTATPQDLAFAQQFVDWNRVEHGIQRVDACRTADGGLLLVELEDLNPYLSLDLLDQATRDTFVQNLIRALHTFMG